MLTVAVVLAVLALLIAVPVGVCALISRPDPVDHAYDTLPAGRPELLIDTATGSHDRYPHMTDNVRHIVTAYCEAMWQHTLNGDTK